MSTSYGEAMQVLSCAPAHVRDSFSHYEGNLPEAWILSAIRGDQRKRLMGTAFPLADPSISGQVPGSRVTGHLKAAGSAASLGGDAFGDKYAAFRRALPERLDRRIGWR